jgi:methionyl-tRNA formyltransferase
MSSKRILFLGSKPIGYRCLQLLADEKDKLGIEIAGVLTSDNTRFGRTFSVKELAEERKLPLFDSLSVLASLEDIDILLSIQYHEILKKEHISVAKQIAVNLHMAPLPEYRGCNQFSFAIVNDDKEFGTTIHKMEPGIDNGDVLFESRFPVPAGCFVNELVELTTERSFELFKKNIKNIVDGSYTLTPQSELAKTRKSSFHLRKDIQTIKKIDLGWPAEKIDRHLRATCMPGFEPPYAEVAGRKIYLNFEWNKKSE